MKKKKLTEMSSAELAEFWREVQVFLNSPLPGSGSSTGASSASRSSRSTALGSAGGASGGRSTPQTTQVWSSGTAASATLFGPVEPPKWVMRIVHPLGKVHLWEEEARATMCGKEMRDKRFFRWYSPKVVKFVEGLFGIRRGDPPPPEMQCKVCTRRFYKLVLGGRYER